MTDPFASSSEPVDPNASVHAPPPTVGQASSIALEDPPAPTPTEPEPGTPVAPPSARPTPPARRRARLPGLPPAWPLLLTAVVLFAAAIGFLVLIATDPTPKSGHRHAASAPSSATSAPTAGSQARLTTPKRINRYVEIPGFATQFRAGLAAALKDGPSSLAVRQALRDANVDAYALAGKKQPSLFLMAFRVADFPHKATETPAAAAQRALASLPLSGARAYPAGPLGGTLRCGTQDVNNATGTVCGWSDGNAFGVLFADPKAKLSDLTLADLTKVARAQLEK